MAIDKTQVQDMRKGAESQNKNKRDNVSTKGTDRDKDEAYYR